MIYQSPTIVISFLVSFLFSPSVIQSSNSYLCSTISSLTDLLNDSFADCGVVSVLCVLPPDSRIIDRDDIPPRSLSFRKVTCDKGKFQKKVGSEKRPEDYCPRRVKLPWLRKWSSESRRSKSMEPTGIKRATRHTEAVSVVLWRSLCFEAIVILTMGQ